MIFPNKESSKSANNNSMFRLIVNRAKVNYVSILIIILTPVSLKYFPLPTLCIVGFCFVLVASHFVLSICRVRIHEIRTEIARNERAKEIEIARNERAEEIEKQIKRGDFSNLS